MREFIRFVRRAFVGFFDADAIPPMPPERPAPRPSHLGRIETAHHEAGHAICAWFSPHTVRVLEVSVLPGKAFMTHKVRLSDTSSQLYDMTVVNLAGLAGVLRIKDKVRSFHFGTDLVSALDAARRLADVGLALPLRHQDRVRDPRFDVARMYRVRPGRRQAIILNDALEEARVRLDRYEAPYARVVARLMERDTIAGDELPSILGPRPWAP